MSDEVDPRKSGPDERGERRLKRKHKKATATETKQREIQQVKSELSSRIWRGNARTRFLSNELRRGQRVEFLG